MPGQTQTARVLHGSGELPADSELMFYFNVLEVLPFSGLVVAMLLAVLRVGFAAHWNSEAFFVVPLFLLFRSFYEA